MADGTQKPISSIQVGDEVVVTDLETGQQSGQRVDAVWVHLDSLYELTTTAEVLRTTEDHPFWSVTDRRFERTDELRRGEQVVSSSGTPVDVVTFHRRAVAVAPAYNLAVADIHAYHVGIESIVFHNSCGDDVEFVGFVDSAPAIVPHGTQGPVPTRAAGSTVCGGGERWSRTSRARGVRTHYGCHEPPSCSSGLSSRRWTEGVSDDRAHYLERRLSGPTVVNDPLDEIEGLELAGVAFVRDYVELHFDGPILRIFSPILAAAGAIVRAPLTPGWRDALCSAIGRRLDSALRTSTGYKFEFAADGPSLEVITEDVSVGAEAMELVPWRAGRLAVEEMETWETGPQSA